MKITDESKGKFVHELVQGMIIKMGERFIMVTDETDEGDYRKYVALETGDTSYIDESRLLGEINDPEENVYLVTDSELLIKSYNS